MPTIGINQIKPDAPGGSICCDILTAPSFLAKLPDPEQAGSGR
jgi:hypothetical protein